MFTPKQKNQFLDAVITNGMRLEYFKLIESRGEMRLVYKPATFYFRVVIMKLQSYIPKDDDRLKIEYNPDFSGITPDPDVTMHQHVLSWGNVSPIQNEWLAWIKREFYEQTEHGQAELEEEREMAEIVATTPILPFIPVIKPKPLAHLHPTVQQAAGTLYATGHYRQALLDAFIAVDNAVQAKSQLTGTGTRLMEVAFSPGNPILKIGDGPDEQQGFMALFRGAMLAIRNPKAHSLNGTHDAQRALEWLSFASVLLRNLDEATLAQPTVVPLAP